MGSTHVQFTLSKQGEIIQLELLQTSGFKNLDRAVINTLEKCRFRPFSINQQAIKEQFSIVYTWRLD